MGTRAATIILIAPTSVVDLSAGWINAVAAQVAQDHRGTLIEFEANFTPTWARFGSCDAYVADLNVEMAMLRWLGEVQGQNFLFIRTGEIEDIAGGWDAASFADVPTIQALRQKNRDYIASQTGTLVELVAAQVVVDATGADDVDRLRAALRDLLGDYDDLLRYANNDRCTQGSDSMGEDESATKARQLLQQRDALTT